MTKEEKVKKRQLRSMRRKYKRLLNDRKYYIESLIRNRASISWGRRYLHGSIFICSMYYGSCELRGYCNGDC